MGNRQTCLNRRNCLNRCCLNRSSTVLSSYCCRPQDVPAHPAPARRRRLTPTEPFSKERKTTRTKGTQPKRVAKAVEEDTTTTRCTRTVFRDVSFRRESFGDVNTGLKDLVSTSRIKAIGVNVLFRVQFSSDVAVVATVTMTGRSVGWGLLKFTCDMYMRPGETANPRRSSFGLCDSRVARNC